MTELDKYKYAIELNRLYYTYNDEIASRLLRINDPHLLTSTELHMSTHIHLDTIKFNTCNEYNQIELLYTDGIISTYFMLTNNYISFTGLQLINDLEKTCIIKWDHPLKLSMDAIRTTDTLLSLLLEVY